MRILFIIGSLRKESFNRQLANVTETLIREETNGEWEVKYLDYSTLPFMNQDIEDPEPKEVHSVREEILSADGLFFFSPEYNGSVTGVLKNLLDWLSRPLPGLDYKSAVIREKKCALCGAGGKNKVAGSLAELNRNLLFLKAQVLEKQNGFSLPVDAFLDGKWILNEETKTLMREEVQEFISFLSRNETFYKTKD